MKCNVCGASCAETDAFCPNCGAEIMRNRSVESASVNTQGFDSPEASPFMRVCAQIMKGKAWLIAVILYTASVAVPLLFTLSGEQSSFNIISILNVIGLWLIYSDYKNRTGFVMRGRGLTLLKSGSIVSIVAGSVLCFAGLISLIISFFFDCTDITKLSSLLNKAGVSLDSLFERFHIEDIFPNILAAVFILISVILIVIGTIMIIYSVLTIKTLNSLRESATTGKKTEYMSKLVLVMLWITGICSVFYRPSDATSFAAAYTDIAASLCGAAATIIFAVLYGKYRNLMKQI